MAYSMYTISYAEAAYQDVRNACGQMTEKVNRIKEVIERTNQGPKFRESLEQLKNAYRNQPQNVFE
jgi:hypothetical protein